MVLPESWISRSPKINVEDTNPSPCIVCGYSMLSLPTFHFKVGMGSPPNALQVNLRQEQLVL